MTNINKVNIKINKISHYLKKEIATELPSFLIPSLPLRPDHLLKPPQHSIVRHKHQVFQTLQEVLPGFNGALCGDWILRLVQYNNPVDE